MVGQTNEEQETGEKEHNINSNTVSYKDECVIIPKTQDVGAVKHEKNNNSICISETREVSADKQDVGANKHAENNNSICISETQEVRADKQDVGAIKQEKNNNSICISETQEVRADKQDVCANKHAENNNSICISETQEVSADKQDIGANKRAENNHTICDKYNENRKVTGSVKASKSNRKSKYLKKRDRNRKKLQQTPNVNESFSESVNSQHQSSPILSPIHVTPGSLNSMLASPSETENGEMQTLVTSCMLPTMNSKQGDQILLQAPKLLLLANITVQELATSRNDMGNDMATTKAGLLIMEEDELSCLKSIHPPQIKGKAAKSQLIKQDQSRKQLKLLEQENLHLKDEIKRYRGSTDTDIMVQNHEHVNRFAMLSDGSTHPISMVSTYVQTEYI